MRTNQSYASLKEKRLAELHKLVPKYQKGKMSFAQMYEEIKHFPINSIKELKGGCKA